jgi:hypothetical protein
MAINVRFQTLFFAAGPGLALLLAAAVAGHAFAYGAGVAVAAVLVLQSRAASTSVLWGRPFAELTEYVLLQPRQHHHLRRTAVVQLRAPAG